MFETIKSIFSSDSSDQTETTYEEKVQQRCRHDWQESVVEEDIVSPADAFYEDGDILIPVFERVKNYCEKCGMSYTDFQLQEYDYTHGMAWKDGYTRQSGYFAVWVDARLDENRNVIEQNPGNIIIEGEGEGRIIVNESEQEVNDMPAAAGGPTD